jgi:hypothetical protein
MLTLSFGGTDEETVERVRQAYPRLIVAWTKTLDGLNIKMQAKIVSEKLQGQVLHHRSGKLANSIRVIPAKIEGNVLSSGVEGAGGPAWYGVVQERGGTRAYEIRPVNKQALAFIPSGSGLSLGQQRTITRGIGKRNPKAIASFTAEGGVVVKSSTIPRYRNVRTWLPRLTKCAARYLSHCRRLRRGFWENERVQFFAQRSLFLYITNAFVIADYAPKTVFEQLNALRRKRGMTELQERGALLLCTMRKAAELFQIFAERLTKCFRRHDSRVAWLCFDWHCILPCIR